MNHNKLSLTWYQLLRQIKSGSELRCGADDLAGRDRLVNRHDPGHLMIFGLDSNAKQAQVWLGVTMEHYAHRENIALYQRLLADPNVNKDQARHAELLRLLAAEVSKDKKPPLRD